MMQLLTLSEFQILAKNAKKVAVFQEIPAGHLTPIAIYSLLNQAYQAPGVMLEDLHQGDNRYSYLCFEPIATLTIQNGSHDNPLTALRHLQSEHRYATREGMAERISSAVGFLTYDAIRYFEAIPDKHQPDPSLPICLFHFYALSIAFDHAKQTLIISTVIAVGHDPDQAFHRARKKITETIALLAHSIDSPPPVIKQPRTITTDVDTSDTDFISMIKKAKNYILRGDAFQIVLSRCFKCHYTVTPFSIYQTLRKVSPAPFMFYFPTESFVILGASPERLVGVQQNTVTVNPIAGTRKRSTEKTDEAITEELLNDKKELAEHLMLVDLARNDVGAVSIPGSVRVDDFMQVKHYSHVSHITSTVKGQLHEKYDAFDALKAAFPAGTLSGAPKIRAMQIIDELETTRRGLYGGAICRLDGAGNLDSCIAIRMAILQNGIACIRTGAGIVYDSNPAAEAQETYAKASSLIDAIAKAHGE